MYLLQCKYLIGKMLNNTQVCKVGRETSPLLSLFLYASLIAETSDHTSITAAALLPSQEQAALCLSAHMHLTLPAGFALSHCNYLPRRRG